MKAIYTAVVCALAMVMSLSAQDLSKEITIEKEVVPEHRSAQKIGVYPSVVSQSLKNKTLRQGEHRVASELQRGIATLEPASCGDTLKDAGYKGYVEVGYFPVFNASLSAGYRIIDTNATQLNAWTQYNGKSYDADILPGNEVTLLSHQLNVGAQLTHKVNRLSAISAGVEYVYNRYNTPVLAPVGDGVTMFDDGYNESVNDVNVNLKWYSQIGELKYNVGTEFSHFAYGQKGYYCSVNPLVDDSYMVYLGDVVKPVRENIFTITGSAIMPYADRLDVGVDVSASVVNYNRNSQFAADAGDLVGLIDAPANDYGIVSLTPHARYETDRLSLKVGLKVDAVFNDGGVLNIAPDVVANWIPVEYLSVYGTLGGGECVNRLASLFDYSRYAAPMFAYKKSSLPIVFDGGVVVGPWRGAYVELFGGYAQAEDWLMPSELNWTNYYTPTDIKGWHGGVEMGYNYSNIVDFSFRYETASQGVNKGYYLWRDRAKNVAKVSLKVTPMESLDIVLGYEQRGDRYYIDYYNQLCDMGDAESVSLGVNYRLSEALSVYGNVENMFNSEYVLVGNIPAQGLNGMVGIRYKF